jgi:tetraacyldisaccharide 4'-kinase
MRLQERLLRAWYPNRPGTPTPAFALWLWPLSLLYGLLLGVRRALYRLGLRPVWHAPVPVLVVGNWVAGGAGKTPSTLALCAALRRLGWRPGIVSRGHGRAGGDEVHEVRADDEPAQVGDEPLLLKRRSGAPVFVGRDRAVAARALLEHHPHVDVLLADDGLQHWALHRDAELVVIDERGFGNHLLLPAGPLRERPPSRLAATQRVLYNAAQPSTPLPGYLARRRLGRARSLAEWWQAPEHAGAQCIDLHQALQPGGDRPLPAVVAAAGTAVPGRFFAALQEAGITAEPCPLPDHFAWPAHPPWPWPARTQHLLVTEKDAIKLRPLLERSDVPQVWVLPLDFMLPSDLVEGLHLLLKRHRSQRGR